MLIEIINKMLADMKSEFRTYDGLLLTRNVGNGTIIKRQFGSISDCYNYVNGVYKKNLVRVSSL